MSEIVIGKDSETILKSRLLRNYEGYRQFIHECELVGRFAKRQELFVTGPPVSEPNLEIISWIKNNAAGRKILDIGCGAGAYSKVLSQEGFECIDIDVNVSPLRKAKNAGVQGLVMDGMKVGFRDKAFDMVLLIEVLEHVVDPGKVLAEARRVAKKRIFITVPNLEPLPHLSQFNVIMHHFLEPTHFNFFTKKMLEALYHTTSGNLRSKGSGGSFPS
jgi:2-polyprenyl-3-methyl-5-hydroxy-6-metoxy-1,4-benzoquinol methylase